MGWRAIFVCGIWLGLCSQNLFAQVPSKPEKPDSLTVPWLQNRIKIVQEKSELPPGVKDNVIAYLQKAIERLEIAQEQLEKAAQFEQKLPLVGEATQTVQKKLDALPPAVDPSLVDVKDLDELDRMVSSREKLLDDAETGLRKQIADLDAEVEQWRIRPEELTNELAEIEDRIQEINDETDNLATSGETKDLMSAHQLFLQARRQRAQNERRALQAEAAWYQSTAAADLLQIQQELATKTMTLKTGELELLQNELGKRRGDEAEQRVHQAEAIVAKIGEDLKPIAMENLELAKEQRDVTGKLGDLVHRHDTTAAALVELDEEFDRTRKMVDDVGLTDAIGLLLRQQRAKLVDPRGIRSELIHRNETVRETRMKMFQLERDSAALIDLDAVAAKRADELDSNKNHKSVDAGLRSLLVEQRQSYKRLETDYQKYFTKLIDLDNVQRRLLDLTTKYAAYVDERVLWIRTGQVFDGDHLAKATPSIRWIADPKSWQAVMDAAWHNVFRQPLIWVIGALLLLLWLGLHPVLKGIIQQQGSIAADTSCRDLWPTLQTLSFSLIIASGWPTVIWFLGSRLDHSVSIFPFVHAVATGLLRAAAFAIPLEVLRIVCLSGGLAERHFGWPPELVGRWRRNIIWYLPLGMVLIGVIGLVEGAADEHRLDTFGRLAFLAFAAVSTVFSQLTIRRTKKRTKADEGTSADEGDVWADRFWRFAPRIGVAACLGLLALGWSGYFYTALQLTWRLQSTAFLAVGLLLVRATIGRWIVLERRRMAILQDEELQTIADAGREPGTAGHNTFLFPRWNWPDFRLNLTQIVDQMHRLLDTGLLTLTVVGLWFVWADVTPALNILNRVTLWETTIEQTVPVNADKDDASPTNSGGAATQTVKRLKRVTAEDLGLASLIFAIAVIAGRNIPGLVEVILLEHLSVDAGTRFAATCLVRYAIFVVGVSFAFGQIGIGWANVQWLVAAGSVGLGFGLQEIFCNFVSGIILLFERPMRVGDVITVGETTGTVSRIRFRATTIVDGDRKELIVPNKEFITGKLLNWTLSDQVNRVGVKVVVSSNNDPVRVRRLLLDIAAQHPVLLKDPAPSAILEDMNGGLTFTVRGFLPSLDGRSGAIHDLYTVIHDRFQAEGIEMPCPSQEVFVRMDRAGGLSPSPPAPHQNPATTPIKPMPADFTSAFRRA